MGNHIISFLDICSIRGQLVLAEAPSIPSIHDKMVYCTGARKHDDDRYIVLDGICLQLLAIRQDSVQLRPCVSEDVGGDRGCSYIF